MTERQPKRDFASRPADPESWIRAPDRSADRASGDELTARLTIDVTPALRGRIKVAAFRRGLTVADILRALLAREFPDEGGTAP
jgi:hypothetical protein